MVDGGERENNPGGVINIPADCRAANHVPQANAIRSDQINKKEFYLPPPHIHSAMAPAGTLWTVPYQYTGKVVSQYTGRYRHLLDQAA